MQYRSNQTRFEPSHEKIVIAARRYANGVAVLDAEAEALVRTVDRMPDDEVGCALLEQRAERLSAARADAGALYIGLLLALEAEPQGP